MQNVTRLLWTLVIATAPAAIAVFYALFGDYAARALRISDMAGDYVTGLIAALVLLSLIQILPIRAYERSLLTMLWLVRCAVTMGAMLFYEGYYVTLDAYTYYTQSILLSDPWAATSFGDGTRNIIWLTSLVAEFTHSYTAMKVVYSFIGLAAVYVFYRAGVRFLGREAPMLLIVLGLFPSILFWTSILGKDPVTSLGVAILSLGAIGYLSDHRPAGLLLFALGVAIAASIRVWLGVIFLAPFLATVLLLGRAPGGVKLGVITLSLPGFLYAIQSFTERFQIESARDLVITSNQLAHGFGVGNSATDLGGFSSIGSLVAFLPQGMFTALFRPLPGEVLNPFGLLAGLENALILGLVGVALWRQRVSAVLSHPVLLWAVLTLGAWAAVYGFVSSHNLGTAFRYRQIVTPILLGLALYLALGPRLHRHRAAAHRAPAGSPA